MSTKQVFVPLKVSPGTKAYTLDTKDLTKEGLKKLHDVDPFMYYSIDKVRIAEVRGRSAHAPDFVNLHELSPGQQDNSPCDDATTTSSSELDSSLESRAPVTTVVRKTRISFEVEPCQLMVDELVDGMEELDLLCDDDDDDGGSGSPMDEDDDDALFVIETLCSKLR